MKRMILIGKSGAGKTTLTRRLLDAEGALGGNDGGIEGGAGGGGEARKTQAVEFHDLLIDTPGEYLEMRSLYRALIVTAADADVIGLLQACNDREARIPPSFASIFPKEVVGVVSKTDLADDPADIEWTEDMLEAAGVTRVFHTSSVTGDGVPALLEYLLE